MKHINLPRILFFVITLFLISCQSKEKNIIGTWVLLNKDGKKGDEIRIQFFDNHTAVALMPGNNVRPVDSISYEIKDEGKLLQTKDKTGRTDELVIVELTQKSLVLHPKADASDTLRLVKE